MTAGGGATSEPRISVPETLPFPRPRFGRSSSTVALGFVTSGAAAYGFLALAARNLGPTRYAPLAAFWSVTFLVGPGCFSVLEKEAGRQLSAGIALEVADSPVVRRVGELGLGLCVVLLTGTALLSPFLLHQLFDSSTLLLFAFSVSIPAMWVQYMAEGILAGNSRFAAYSVMPAGEGATRLLLGVVLLACGVRTAGPLGLAVAVAPAISALLVISPLRRSRRHGPDVSRAALGRSIGWMLGGTVGSSILVNSGPIVVKALAGASQQSLAGRFLSGMVLVRVPLFLFNSAAATLLPALAGHAATQDWTAFRRTMNRLIVGLAGLGLVSTITAATVGPTLLRIIFGAPYRLGGPDLAAMAGSAAVLLLATTLSVALMAVGRARALCASWAAGVVVMAMVVAALSPLLERVELGMLLGSGATCAFMVGVVYRTSRADASVWG